MSKINFELVQDKYTNLILYDNSTRCDGASDWIDIDSLNQIDITFKSTSSIVETNHTFRFDNTKNAYVIAYDDFIPFNGSDYNNAQGITLEINGVEYAASCDENMSDKATMIAWLTTNITSPDVTFYDNGDKIYAVTTDGSGTDSNIKIIDGTLLDYLCWNKGNIKGNDFVWNDASVEQPDLYFTLETDAIDLLDEISDGYLDVELYIEYTDGSTQTYTDSWTEFLYEITEIYRARIFEYIANNFVDFQTVEQRWQTDMEIFSQKSIYFDALYKAFLAAVTVGNKTLAYNLLLELVTYRELNVIN